MNAQMSFEDFLESIRTKTPPLQLRASVLALWRDAIGDWDGAHELSQEENSRDGAWVHAYLHRKEGDASNAAYWYQRAGRPVASSSLESEWEAIARELLKRAP
jgi:hypothetical protein